MSMKNPKNEFEVWVEEVHSGKYPHLYIEPDTGLIGLSEEMVAKFKKIDAKYDLYKSAAHLREEGMFDITIVKCESMYSADGLNIIFTLDTEEEIDGIKTVYKAGIFYDGFAPDSDIELVTHNLVADAKATIRLSKNYRGDQYYVRYVSTAGREAGNLEEPF